MFFYPHDVLGSPNLNGAENLIRWWQVCFCSTKESSFVLSMDSAEDLLHLSPPLVKSVVFVTTLTESQANMLTEACSWPGPEDWLMVRLLPKVASEQ